MKRDDLSCDYSDEPRTDGKSSLDLFRESCEAADRARREENDQEQDGTLPPR